MDDSGQLPAVVTRSRTPVVGSVAFSVEVTEPPRTECRSGWPASPSDVPT